MVSAERSKYIFDVAFLMKIYLLLYYINFFLEMLLISLDGVKAKENGNDKNEENKSTAVVLL